MMTPEQKEKLEQAADKIYHPVSAHKEHYLAGAQNILDNPRKWGLVKTDDVTGLIERLAQIDGTVPENAKLKAENTRLREALERAYNDFRTEHWSDETYNIVEEALKQQG